MPAWWSVSTRYLKSSGVPNRAVGRVVAGDLVAPRRPVRVLHHGEQLDVGEAEVDDVVDEVLGEVAVRHPLAPRAEVDLVDAHRALVRVAAGALLEPRLVAPRVPGLVDDGPGVRRALGAPRHRVGLGAHDVVGAADLVLVDRPDADLGDEQLPHPGGADEAHRVDPPVPVVEVADDAHGLGARGPHGERDAAHAAHRAGVLVDPGAEDGPQLLVAALADEVEVDLAEGGGEAVGVVLEVLDAVGPGDEEAVVHRPGGVGAHGAPGALGLVDEVEDLVVLEPHPDRGREGLEDADPQALVLHVLTEEVVRLLVAPLDECRDGSADLGAGGGGHCGSPCVVVAGEKWAVRRRTAPSGMPTHPGRLRAS